MSLNEKTLSFYKRIIHSAETHGMDSDPDHEVGDLQDALSTCMELLSPDQLNKFIEIHQDSLSPYENEEV